MGEGGQDNHHHRITSPRQAEFEISSSDGRGGGRSYQSDMTGQTDSAVRFLKEPIHEPMMDWIVVVCMGALFPPVHVAIYSVRLFMPKESE